jgi:DNA-binding transcriptional regulator YhcF (GntR family)
MEFKSGNPIYKQIGELIMEDILIERLKSDDKIPSVREMSVNTETNPNTVARTYSWLQDMGIIYNKRGKGYFIEQNALQKVDDETKYLQLESA